MEPSYGYTTERMERTFADGTPVAIGVRVFRTHAHDGSRHAGKRRGPMLTVAALRHHEPKDGPRESHAIAVLRHSHTKTPAGTEFVWNLRRAFGRQPDTRKTKASRVTVRDQTVSSIRLPQELRDRLALRGDEITVVIRRDVDRLYDMLDRVRETIVFPAGTLAELAKAWTLAAPPPPHNNLPPQYFIPVVVEACKRLATPEAFLLSELVRAWNPIEALAVQDAVERWAPETTETDRLRNAGLREAAPEKPRKVASK